MKNSTVPPTTCAPGEVAVPVEAVLPYSHMSPPTCLACGIASRSFCTSASVILRRFSISGESGPNCTAGKRWMPKTLAPSAPICLSIDFCNPLSSAIMATTVKTPMTMPSSVSPERSLCPDSAARASRRSSSRDVSPRRRRCSLPATSGFWPEA